jgi:hypothetical protein
LGDVVLVKIAIKQYTDKLNKGQSFPYKLGMMSPIKTVLYSLKKVLKTVRILMGRRCSD